MAGEKPEVCVDQVSVAIGESGPWQYRIAFIASLTFIISAWHMLVMSFYAPEVDHWCKPPNHLFNNLTTQQWKNYSIPHQKQMPEKYSQCSMYERNYSYIPEDAYTPLGENISSVDCMYGWDYDKSHFKHSLENEFDLVCSRSALAAAGSGSFNFGILMGVVVFGQVSDLIGRKKTSILSISLSLVAAVITAFMPELEYFFITRFFIAMGVAGSFTTAFVLAMELVDGKWRTIIGIGMEFSWCFGYIVLTLLAYLIPDWRHLQLTISVPIVLFLSYWWILPESPRWLLSQGQVKKAVDVAKVAARQNKMDENIVFTATALDNSEDKKRTTVLDLFRYPIIRGRTLNLYFNWFVNSFVYYGLSLGTSGLGGNLFITFLISGAIEVPAYALSMYVLMKCGRRIPHSVSMVVGGVACIATAGFSKGVYKHDWPIVTLAMIGKFGISASFAIVYVFSAEIYPTVVRNVGVGSSSMFARIGSVIAPFVNLLKSVHPSIPLVTYGLFSVAAGLLILLLPETNNKKVPETIEEAEKFR